MQYKEGSWWKACYDEERNLYTVETRGRGTYNLYEIDAETYERLGDPKMDGLETERMIVKGRHLYEDVDDVYCGMPYTHVFDKDYVALCPWARIQNSGHKTPDELMDIGVEYFENDKTKVHWKKKTDRGEN